MTAKGMPLEVAIELGDHDRYFARVRMGGVEVIVYEHRTERGDVQVIVEVDHEEEPLKIYSNDCQLYPQEP